MDQIDPFILKICKQITAATSRSVVVFTDAKWLSSELAQKKVFLSSHTIARLYGIIKPYRKPYKETLNGLASYLDYADWEEYIANQTTLYSDPNFFLTESNDGFSQSVLELALITRNYDEVGRIIEKYEGVEINNAFFSTPVLIGVYLKTNNYEKKLLQALAQSKQGHRLFYESFVDEDNANNYFSDALLNYYLPKTENPYRKLFVYTYVISQTAYNENKLSQHFGAFIAILPQLTLENCHFQEVSRWFECSILGDGFNNKLQETCHSHLDTLVTYCEDNEVIEWALYRSLKALLHFGFTKEVLSHKSFNKLVNSVIKRKNSFNSIALYGLQLYWLYSEKLVLKNQIYNPFRISINYFHSDNNEKLAIEFATASLFASGNNKLFLDQQLVQFCRENGKRWILNLINA